MSKKEISGDDKRYHDVSGTATYFKRYGIEFLLTCGHNGVDLDPLHGTIRFKDMRMFEARSCARTWL